MAKPQIAQDEVFLSRWGTTAREARPDYVEAEVQRVIDSGGRVLTESITAPLADQQDAALRAMRALSVTTVRLRLVPNASPPHCDPNGRELPEEKRGKVLAAKVGTISPTKDDSPEYQNQFTGTAREARLQRGQPIYRAKEITRDGIDLPIEEAMVVLRQWGRGVHTTRWADMRAKTGDRWIVEEVPIKQSDAERVNQAGRK
jgi:hypothetical protein